MYEFKVLDKLNTHKIVKKLFLINLVIISFFIGILFLPWEQTVEGEGILIAKNPLERDHNILSTVEGFIDNIYVHENQEVKKGDLLFSVVDLDDQLENRLKTISGSSEEKVKNFQNQLLNYENKLNNLNEYLENGIDIYNKKILIIEDNIKNLNILKETMLTNKETINKIFKRVEYLYNEGIESKERYELEKNKLTKAIYDFEKISIDINIAKKSKLVLEDEKENFIKETKNKTISLKNSNIDSNVKINSTLQELERNELSVQRYKSRNVYAKTDGKIIRILKNNKNRFVKKGDEIMHFAPKITEKIILFKITDFNMPLIKNNLPVRIAFYGFPFMQVSGWPKIEKGTYSGIISNSEDFSYEKGYYYGNIIETDDEKWPGDFLRIGTRAQLWIRLETVPIWYQLWRLINALPPEIVKDVKK